MSAQQKSLVEELAPSMLYHITHIDNLQSILEKGLYAHNNPYQQRDISRREVNARRVRLDPVYNKKIHDYVPLFFNPRNAMLYNIQNRYESEIVILGFDSCVLSKQSTLFTNGNAAANNTEFFNDLQFLREFNWNIVFSRSWNGFGEFVKKAMMSEVLVDQYIGMEMLQSINCSSMRMEKAIRSHFPLNKVDVTTDTSLFFENLL